MTGRRMDRRTDMVNPAYISSTFGVAGGYFKNAYELLI